jgi:hypothetical protein
MRTVARLHLVQVLVVIVRWSKDLFVIFINFGLLVVLLKSMNRPWSFRKEKCMESTVSVGLPIYMFKYMCRKIISKITRCFNQLGFNRFRSSIADQQFGCTETNHRNSHSLAVSRTEICIRSCISIGLNIMLYWTRTLDAKKGREFMLYIGKI